MSRHRMLRGVLMHSGVRTGTARPRLKVPCKKLNALKSAALLRFAQASGLHHTPTATLVIECNDALITLAVLARCRR